ncbi:MAG: ATP-binding protein [Desulfobulbaceae bacterium]|nr:ATP-binding protein [Desulfobulbaceae bacterium]
MSQKLQVQPVFVNTGNVRNFGAMMDGLELGAGEGRLGLVSGRAGRGKTRTSQAWHANNDSVYLRMVTAWRTSELAFLQQLCRELGVARPAHRKGPAYYDALEQLQRRPVPVFLDELEKMSRHFLDLVRDLSDQSTAPFVMIGEEELASFCRQNRRVWSRVFEHLDFAPIAAPDVIVFAKQAAGLGLDAKGATLLHTASEGDFRLVKRCLIALVQDANAKGVDRADEGMVKVAIKRGLRG